MCRTGHDDHHGPHERRDDDPHGVPPGRRRRRTSARAKRTGANSTPRASDLRRSPSSSREHTALTTVARSVAVSSSSRCGSRTPSRSAGAVAESLGVAGGTGERRGVRSLPPARREPGPRRARVPALRGGRQPGGLRVDRTGRTRSSAATSWSSGLSADRVGGQPGCAGRGDDGPRQAVGLERIVVGREDPVRVAGGDRVEERLGLHLVRIAPAGTCSTAAAVVERHRASRPVPGPRPGRRVVSRSSETNSISMLAEARPPGIGERADRAAVEPQEGRSRIDDVDRRR